MSRRRTRGLVALLPALVPALLVAPLLAGAAQAADPPAPDPTSPLPDTVTFAHQVVLDSATAAAGDLVVLSGDYGREELPDHLWATVRSADGTWGTPVELAGSHGDIQYADLAVAADGTGVVAWSSYTRGGKGPTEIWSRQRRADGTFGPATQLARGGNVFGPEAAVAAPGGRAAVEFDGNDYRTVIATRTPQRGWRQITAPVDLAEAGLSMDATGGLHAVSQDAPRGGGGTLEVGYLAPDAVRWTHLTRVRTPYLSTDPAQLLVTPAGREYLLVGFVGTRGYRPPGDTELVGSTAYRLLTRTAVGRPWRTLWTEQGVGDAQLSRGTDGSLRLTWEKWHGHVHRRPVSRTLVTAPVRHGRPTTPTVLATAPRGPFSFEAAGGSAGAVTWLEPKGGPLRVAGVGASGLVTPTTLDDASLEPDWRGLAQTGSVQDVAGRPWVLWQHGYVLEDAHGDPVDSALSVAPVPVPVS